jgi:hypothetical protein
MDSKKLLDLNEKWLKKVKETAGKMLQDYAVTARDNGLKSTVHMKVLEIGEGESAKVCPQAQLVLAAKFLNRHKT